jgi:hypothetical protein
MSLITSASVWTNDNTDDIRKKRIPTLRKTVKKLPSIGPDEYITQERVFQENSSNSIEDVKSAQETRNNRVEQLIDEMSSINGDNDGNKLANFKPLEHPAIQKRIDATDDPVVQGKMSDDPFPIQLNPLQIPPPLVRQRPGGSDYSSNMPDLGNSNNPYMTNPYSNYKNVYRPQQVTVVSDPRNTYFGQANAPQHDDKLMEKINYMIHMLEQQHNEKTSNVTEEFILYSFLGVFIIFVVDAFARAGKYTR